MESQAEDEVIFPSPPSIGIHPVFQLFLILLATNGQGQEEEAQMVPGSKGEVLSPSLPFHIIPFTARFSLIFQGLAW